MRRRDSGAAFRGPISGNPDIGDAAPAGRLRKPALGRSRDPTGGHYDPSAGSSAGQAALKGSLAAEARSGVEPARRGRRTQSRASPGSADPGSEIAACGAPRGAAHRQRCAHIRNGRADRRATPSILRGKGKTGVPSASTKNMGDDACLGAERAGPAPTAWFFKEIPAKPNEQRGFCRLFDAPVEVVQMTLNAPIPRCIGASFLAISAGFPVGVKRPQKRPSSTLPGAGGGVPRAST